MSVQPDFAEFLRRIRCGDPEAAQELVRRYESTIRLAVRTRLTDPALERQLDSADICQSVLASFFVRAAAGQYDLADPGQLVAPPGAHGPEQAGRARPLPPSAAARCPPGQRAGRRGRTSG